MNTHKTQLVLALTCAHCGRQRHFSGDRIDVFLLMYMDAQTCNRCGKLGATLTMTSCKSPLRFELETLPCVEPSVTRRPGSPAR